jgi:hypothetical protein
MLHFLRRIRRNLLNTGATRKYLIYAVGEILLVMIGILLALQVNNWNEVRKLRIDEIRLLQDLRTDFGIKTKQMQQEYEISKKINESTIRFIMSQLNHQKETFDLKDYLFFGDYYPTSAHINSLEVALNENTINKFKSDSLITMLRKLKANLVNLEKDADYMEELWVSDLVPFLQETGLNIHRFALIYKGIEPNSGMLKGIDEKVYANKVSALASIQIEWLKKQITILEEMNNIIRLAQVELER